MYKITSTLLIFLILNIGYSQSENCKQMRLFNKLWKKIDRYYASFEIKGIDWQQSYEQYKSQITPDLTQDQLLAILKEMLKPFNDGHVGVAELRLFPLSLGKGFSAERDSYFYKEFPNDSLRRLLFATSASTLVKYGFDSLPFGYNSDREILDFSVSNDIGYMHVSHMEGISPKETRCLMLGFLDQCQNFKAIIIDVRDNQGGLTQVVDQITGAFIDQKKHVSNEYKKKRKNHTSFNKAKPYYCKPICKNPFDGNVIILTNDRTRSAGENFVMSIMDLPNVTIIGDRTEGMLGSAKIGFLPYGWIFGVNNYKVLTPDGINYEDIGIPPDIFIQNKMSDIGIIDPVIEKAIEFISSQNKLEN